MEQIQRGCVMSLHIPVNPDYDWDNDPAGQAEYVNPVILNNKLIQNANAFIMVSQKQFSLTPKLVEAKQEHREAVARRKEMEKTIISEGKPTTNDRKTILLLEAFISYQANVMGLAEEYSMMQDTEESTKNLVEIIQGKMAANEQIIKAIDASTLGIQTHLSYVKSEISHARNY